LFCLADRNGHFVRINSPVQLWRENVKQAGQCRDEQERTDEYAKIEVHAQEQRA
jgi:hypothetical protein